MSRAPTTDQLAVAPELALLSALEATLDATISALLAAHPELRSRNGRLPSAQIADVVIARSLELREAINRYRLALVVTPLPRRGRARNR